jgi:hypothetical protein
MAIGTAFRAFFGCLFNAEASTRVKAALADNSAAIAPPEKEVVKPKAPPVPPKPARSEALTLLAALQREARFVDFLQESLDGYPDAQVGAAARDVHRDCREVVERMFAIRPLRKEEESSEVEVPTGFEPELYRLVGDVSGEGPYKGRLAHHGWRASKCETPQWNGSKEAADVVSPAEVEIQ